MSGLRYLTRESKSKRLIDYTVHGVPESPLDESITWRLDVGAECNLLLDLADSREAHGGSGYVSESNEKEAKALRSIVTRVAAFEDLEFDTKEKEIL